MAQLASCDLETVLCPSLTPIPDSPKTPTPVLFAQVSERHSRWLSPFPLTEKRTGTVSRGTCPPKICTCTHPCVQPAERPSSPIPLLSSPPNSPLCSSLPAACGECAKGAASAAMPTMPAQWQAAALHNDGLLPWRFGGVQIVGREPLMNWKCVRASRGSLCPARGMHCHGGIPLGARSRRSHKQMLGLLDYGKINNDHNILVNIEITITSQKY